MKPELPQVNAETPHQEILSSLEKAYQDGEQSPGETQEANTPVINPGDLLRAGSVGVEAGLNNFELTKDDNSGQSSAATDDDAMNDAVPVAPLVPTAKVGSVAVAQTPAVAADKDEIEQQWVTKAKKIVEQTKSDPYLQERAVSRLQADYMKKRFNKDIKLPEEGKNS
jgi:hypothetical protein